MERRTQSYAIRLAVEGGGQLKAELVSGGQSGEQSLKRIETAGGKASGGLKDLGRQAEVLRTGSGSSPSMSGGLPRSRRYPASAFVVYQVSAGPLRAACPARLDPAAPSATPAA